MSSRPRLLLVARSREAAGALQHMLSSAPDLSIETRLIDEHDLDPLGGVMRSPDLLLLKLNGRSHEELGELLRYGAEERPPLIVIGDASNAQSMRIAMQAGARDFLTEPVLTEDLLAAIELVSAERRGSKSHKHCELVAFINAKGGSGATFLACNVAHLFTSVSNLKTAIVDLDLQFGTLPQYLDVQPKRGLLEALDVADDLDGVAIDAYLTRHESGLSILAGLRDSAMLQQDSPGSASVSHWNKVFEFNPNPRPFFLFRAAFHRFVLSWASCSGDTGKTASFSAFRSRISGSWL